PAKNSGAIFASGGHYLMRLDERRRRIIGPVRLRAFGIRLQRTDSAARGSRLFSRASAGGRRHTSRRGRDATSLRRTRPAGAAAEEASCSGWLALHDDATAGVACPPHGTAAQGARTGGQ